MEKVLQPTVKPVLSKVIDRNTLLPNAILKSYDYWRFQKPGTKKNAAFLSFVNNCEKEGFTDITAVVDELGRRTYR